MEWRRHGFPPGFRFTPTDAELIMFLDCKLRGQPLPLPAVFHDLNIRDFHPDALAEKYRNDAEDGYIYFFTTREFQNPKGSKKRPMRTTRDGCWKASGGAEPIMNNDVEIGKRVTVVFYEGKSIKTDWGIHEYTSRQQDSGKVPDLTLCRLYVIKGGKKKRDELPAPSHALKHEFADGCSAAISGKRRAAADVGYDNFVDTTPLAMAPPMWQLAKKSKEDKTALSQEQANLNQIQNGSVITQQTPAVASSRPAAEPGIACRAGFERPIDHNLPVQQPDSMFVYGPGYEHPRTANKFVNTQPLAMAAPMWKHTPAVASRTRPAAGPSTVCKSPAVASRTMPVADPSIVCAMDCKSLIDQNLPVEQPPDSVLAYDTGYACAVADGGGDLFCTMEELDRFLQEPVLMDDVSVGAEALISDWKFC